MPKIFPAIDHDLEQYNLMSVFKTHDLTIWWYPFHVSFCELIES